MKRQRLPGISHHRYSGFIRPSILCLIVLLMVLLAVAACSGTPQNENPFPTLQIPGVQKLPGVERVEQQAGVHVITGIAAYQSVRDHQTTHVLFLLRHDVYEMRLDGSQLHRLALACDPPITVAPDGRWFACHGMNNGVLTMHALTGEQPDHDIVVTADSPYLDGLTWAPDGLHFAVINGLKGGCSIAIYQVNAAHDRANLTTVLPLPHFRVVIDPNSNSIGCSASNLTWSPDGSQLAFVERGSWAVYDLSLAALHLTLQQLYAAPKPITITSQVLTILGFSSYHSNLAWDRSSRMLTFVSSDGWTIEQADVVTYKETVLLTQKTTGILGIFWIPNDERLLFVLGMVEDEYQPPPTQIYTYAYRP